MKSRVAGGKFRGKAITRRRFNLVNEGEFQEHRRKGMVPIWRAYLLDRNKYQPKVATRPREALKASQRYAGNWPAKRPNP